MSEYFLHYLWQFQYFDKRNLATTRGEEIQIFNPGNRNDDAGPDFFNARVKIGDIEWIGNVEIHVDASSWAAHGHTRDLAYENVILHVVWKDNKSVKRMDDSIIPTLELKNRVDDQLLLNANRLINSPENIPCHANVGSVTELTKLSMMDKALLQRLQAKAGIVLEMLQRNTKDWEETTYQLVGKNFGFNVNSEPFLQLLKTLPYKTLMKHADQVLQLEAFLFGQAGFLEDVFANDKYHQVLKREYALLSQKYQLTGKKLLKAQWKFLRLRPANFPTIRLAQFAMLLYRQKNLFSRIIEAQSPNALRELFTVQQSDYWLSHFRFFKPAIGPVPLGGSSIDNILINTVAPLLAAYSKEKDDQVYMDRAVDLLQAMPAENNAITRMWTAIGFKSKTGFDTQALIELYNTFCLKRKCLDCAIGASLVKPIKK